MREKFIKAIAFFLLITMCILDFFACGLQKNGGVYNIIDNHFDRLYINDAAYVKYNNVYYGELRTITLDDNVGLAESIRTILKDLEIEIDDYHQLFNKYLSVKNKKGEEFKISVSEDKDYLHFFPPKLLGYYFTVADKGFQDAMNEYGTDIIKYVKLRGQVMRQIK